jgi:hypothetical protein
MSSHDLKALLQAEKADALAGMTASKLSQQRQDALDYYLGDMENDMPRPEGRSGAVSTDVADTIEGLMPALMEIFASGDEVVRFEPVGPEDEKAAEQETDYVNHVFMQKNPGFLILYSFIKDALLSKVGIVKGAYEKNEVEERETYYDLSEDAYAFLAADETVEVVEHTERPAGMAGAGVAAGGDYPAEAGVEVGASQPTTHDVTIVKRKEYGCAKVYNVPPEEFGIERNASCIREANYVFHKTKKPQHALIAQGYDAGQLNDLTAGEDTTGESEARNTVEDHTGGSDRANRAARLIEVTEHYIRCDYERSGKAGLYRVVTAGADGEILKRDGKEDIEPIDVIPFAAMTPVIMTHRFFGRSIADLVMDIQQIKTKLIRSLLDNADLSNNPRTEVSESHAGPNTLDDLLTSRPGGIIRMKAPGGLTVHQTPTIADKVFPMLEYWDATREWRTGVTRQGQGIDANALQNQSATAVNQAFTAAQARMKLIARIFAETGIRDLFSMLHGIIRRNESEANTVKLRGEWVPVNPRDWKTRNDLTISVGLGDGGKQQQLAFWNMVLQVQEKIVATGGAGLLVSMDNIYASLKKLMALGGEKSIEPYFNDPKGQQPEPKTDPKLQIEQMKLQASQQQGQADAQLKVAELQMKAEIEKTQAQADIAVQQRKTEAEIALAERKFALERELKLMDHQMKVQTAEIDVGMKREGHQMSLREKGMMMRQKDDGDVEAVSADDARSERIEAAFQALAQSMAQMSDGFNNMARVQAAPKRIVRGPDGRASHAETVMN